MFWRPSKPSWYKHSEACHGDDVTCPVNIFSLWRIIADLSVEFINKPLENTYREKSVIWVIYAEEPQGILVDI